ncbi:uncharacterized protein LY89DRAFT_684617 [Mollisia scopiformis]|uniref:Uncharacterized protein n=1 Tax=Mollisia scopiformis TaxID=149040 RepID=A0A194XBS2_MOLSC|nr:uncharacterized protein LY89DRAFT_684617 [Mollisia scopiformis]KUJ17614.1 hypothetical protein LY89DRAFT_684617 [Mollisia scopiformis]
MMDPNFPPITNAAIDQAQVAQFLPRYNTFTHNNRNRNDPASTIGIAIKLIVALAILIFSLQLLSYANLNRGPGFWQPGRISGASQH